MADTVKVDGREYPFPPDNLNLGEMCDAENYFGVDFNTVERSGVRFAAALLYIAVRRERPDVTVDDIRRLPPDLFQQLAGGDADPQPPSSEGSNGPTSNASTESSDGSGPAPPSSGSPGSDTTSRSDLVTSKI